MTEVVNARVFWRWFADNENRLRRIDDSNRDDLLDEVENQLHAYFPGLSCEIGGGPEGPREFIVTAEGNVDLMDRVQELVGEAPKLEGWRIIAFKPPMGFDFSTRHESVRVDAKELWFRPLESAALPGALGLLVGVPMYDRSLHDEFLFAVKVALRTALGELTWATVIKHVDVGPLQGTAHEGHFMPIAKLPRYIEWKREGRGTGSPGSG